MKRKNGVCSSRIMKLCVLFVLIAATLAFTGCQAKAKTFTKAGLTIELTDAFTEKESSSYTVYYESNDAVVIALREAFSLQEGFDQNSLKDYAQMVIDSNDRNSQIVEEDGLTYFVFNSTVDGNEFKYFACVYKSDDAFWLIQFGCAASDYDGYKDTFANWAKTVEV